MRSLPVSQNMAGRKHSGDLDLRPTPRPASGELPLAVVGLPEVGASGFKQLLRDTHLGAPVTYP